jgi:FkbM family methyltransferase
MLIRLVPAVTRLKNLAKRVVNRLRRGTAPIEPDFIPTQLHCSDGKVEFDFWVNSAESASWYNPDAWFRGEEYRQLSRLIKPGDRVLEAGCNIGFTTMNLSRLVGKDGFVLALDVVPANVIVAQATAFLNGANNVRVLCTAVGAAQGEVGFVNQLNGHLDPKACSKSPVTSCDALDKEFGPFNVLKVDVEGYEGFVLKGASHLLSRFPKLALEIHGNSMPIYGTTIAELLHLFQAEKYEGTMFIRPEYRVEDFRSDKLRSDAIGNVFLSPKPV